MTCGLSVGYYEIPGVRHGLKVAGTQGLAPPFCDWLVYIWVGISSVCNGHWQTPYTDLERQADVCRYGCARRLWNSQVYLRFHPRPEMLMDCLNKTVVTGVCVCSCVNPEIVRVKNSSPVQAGTTKVGDKLQNTLINIPVTLGSDWPWLSRWILT